MSYLEDKFLSKWPIFSLLEETFLHSLKLVCVFGSSGNEALTVTCNDEVYALGSNVSGCLGIGDMTSTLEPRRVKELCYKGVVDIVFGSGPHVIALAKSGELYSWGHNGYGQLGLGVAITTSQGTIPHCIRGCLEGLKVTEVACGGHHTLALTSEGMVFSWGYNNCGQLGSGSTQNYLTPMKVGGALSRVRCSSVCCCHASSVALSESGELYSWGYNGNGQLGVDSNTNYHSPFKIRLEDTIIKQIVCGYAHMLALTDKGKLYAWGSNMYGQLGTGTKLNLLIPTQVAVELGSLIQVAACHNNHISGASLLNGKVYMWGMCRDQNVLSPVVTRFKSLDDIFACFASSASTWRTLTPIREESYGLVQCIADRFNDASTSDLTILVEGQKIYVHKAILRMRCEYFRSMFQQGRWTEADKDCIEICHYTHSVYHAFLKYLYTDKLDECSVEETIGLLELADSYCEKELKKYCERLIWKCVTVDNVATLMTMASKYRTVTLEEQCMSFALTHMTQIVQSDSFEQLDCSVAKTFIQKAADRGAFKT